MTDIRSSREVYRDMVTRLLPQDERLVCLDSDTGLFNGVEFGTAADRYINVGIAEQTLVGAAAGLAREGRVPLVNTMAAFAASRALEAVKVDVALNGLPVRIAATHSGVSGGHLGPTHHALEDLAVMRSLPGMTVVVPGDAATTEELFRQSLELPGPVYLRLGRNATPALAEGPPVWLGEAQWLSRGTDITLAACGPLPVLAATAASERLAARGISVSLLHLHTVKPLDTAALVEAASRSSAVVTVEEHWGAGGFGSAVAEALSEHVAVRVHRMAMPDSFVSVAGGHQYLAERGGISAQAVTERAVSLLETTRRAS